MKKINLSELKRLIRKEAFTQKRGIKIWSRNFVSLSKIKEKLTDEEFAELDTILENSDFCFGTNEISGVKLSDFLYILDVLEVEKSIVNEDVDEFLASLPRETLIDLES